MEKCKRSDEGRYIIGRRYFMALSSIRFSKRLLVLDAASRALRVAMRSQSGCASAGRDADSFLGKNRKRSRRVS